MLWVLTPVSIAVSLNSGYSFLCRIAFLHITIFVDVCIVAN